MVKPMPLFVVLAVRPEEPLRWYPVRQTPNATVRVEITAERSVLLGIDRQRARETTQGALSSTADAQRFYTRSSCARACTLLRDAFPAYSFRVYQTSR
jgi:hypothetical protein